MRFEGRQRAALINHCWSIYLCLTDTFTLADNFHSEFPVAVETALITGALHIVFPIGANLTPSLNEEYVFDRQRLTVSRYSYNVIDANGDNLLRAVNLPYHRTDYRGRALTHPPNHMHDARGKLLSFSGRIEDFIHHLYYRDLLPRSN
jgi:hypothetical protein